MTKETKPLRLVKKFWNKQPAGYAAGATLRRIQAELQRRLTTVSTEGTRALLEGNGGRFRCAVEERVESHFMMHIVTAEFALHVPAAVAPGAKLNLNNSGLLRKRGIRCRTSRRWQEELKQLCAALEQDAAVSAALTGLNFRNCQIEAIETGWSIRLEPYGGSEVVNRLPAFRRYIRLGPEQVDCLVLALHALSRVLNQQSK